jgi:uncharacterized protein
MERVSRPDRINKAPTADSAGNTPESGDPGNEAIRPVFGGAYLGDQQALSPKSVFIGGQGLRAGWSVLIFVSLFLGFLAAVNIAFARLHLVSRSGQIAVRRAFFGELGAFLAMLAAAAVVALIERRGVLDYNLNDPRRQAHFFSGLAAGFIALSVLIGCLAGGGWLHFGPVALSGTAIAKYAALWGCTFLLVACVEEGLFRCYLQFTLTRGINFWWALGIELAICLDLVLRVKGNGNLGVYAAALLGFVPCLLLYLRRPTSSGFWQAAWVTSTFFGFVHTSNGGENWVGIFAASLIGFVFCVSVWVTGSAWWAIGCHAAWDWAETYFYGATDSGAVARGHYLSTSPAGNAQWSGGADGPEGSLLVVGVILLLALLLLFRYRRNKLRSDIPPPT